MAYQGSAIAAAFRPGLGRWLVGWIWAVLRFVRRKPTGGAGLLICVVFLVVGIAAPVIAPYDPNFSGSYLEMLERPSAAHWFGTDEFGRDIYSRIISGAWISIQVAFFAIGLGTATGFLLGVVSGYLGGTIDMVLQRFTDSLLAFPPILLAMALVAMLGAGLDKVIIAISIIYVPVALRFGRGQVLSVKQNTYVEAARAVGASTPRIVALHVLPNVAAVFLIVASIQIGNAILIEASLSYLGLGVPPPYPSWGRMLAGGAQAYAMTAPWMAIFPGLAITLLVLGFNLLGDALRDVWDPKLRGRTR